MVHHGIGNDAHLMTGPPCAPAQVKVVAVERELGIESAQRIPHIAADEHPGGADGVHLTALIVLPLVVLAALEPRDAAPRPRDTEADLEEEPAVVPAEGLGAEDRGPRVGVGGLEEPLEAGGRRRGVVVEEPDPLRGLHVEGLVAIRLQYAGRKAGVHRRTESALRVGAVEYDDAVIAEGFGEDTCAGVGGTCIDTDDCIGMTSLSAEDREDRGEPDRAIRCDDDGRDAVASAQTACFFSRRRSRSDRPPQMPKRSSLASAYSRHSPRTSQDRHTRFASRVLPPFSGKNASGSV